MLATQLLIFCLIHVYAAITRDNKRLRASIYHVSRWFEPGELSRVIDAVILKPKVHNTCLSKLFGYTKRNTEEEDFADYQTKMLLNYLMSDPNGPRLHPGQWYNLVYELASPKVPNEFEALQLLFRILCDELNHELVQKLTQSPLNNLFSALPKRPDRAPEYVCLLVMAGSWTTPKLIDRIQEVINQGPGDETSDLKICLEILNYSRNTSARL